MKCCKSACINICAHTHTHTTHTHTHTQTTHTHTPHTHTCTHTNHTHTHMHTHKPHTNTHHTHSELSSSPPSCSQMMLKSKVHNPDWLRRSPLNLPTTQWLTLVHTYVHTNMCTVIVLIITPDFILHTCCIETVVIQLHHCNTYPPNNTNELHIYKHDQLLSDKHLTYTLINIIMHNAPIRIGTNLHTTNTPQTHHTLTLACIRVWPNMCQEQWNIYIAHIQHMHCTYTYALYIYIIYTLYIYICIVHIHIHCTYTLYIYNI